MAEIKINVNIPEEFREEFETALGKVVEQFVRRLRFSILDDIMAKSKLTDEQADKLADDLKKRVAKRHGL